MADFDPSDPFGMNAPAVQSQAPAAVKQRGAAPPPAMLPTTGVNGPSEKAQRMFAASQARAAAEEAAAAAPKAPLEGASASAFESRERTARKSILAGQQGMSGMPAVAFPMTDLVDAQNDKK